MSTVDLETRMVALEGEVARLSQLLKPEPLLPESSWKNIVGIFENDPLFEQAMKQGLAYRDSTRPKPRRRKKI